MAEVTKTFDDVELVGSAVIRKYETEEGLRIALRNDYEVTLAGEIVPRFGTRAVVIDKLFADLPQSMKDVLTTMNAALKAEARIVETLDT